MRLIDEIRTGMPLFLGGTETLSSETTKYNLEFRRLLSQNLPVILSDNVDQFFFDSHGISLSNAPLEKESIPTISLADEFPNAIPPFPLTWIEWVPSQHIFKQLRKRVGALVEGIQTDLGWQIKILGFLNQVGERHCIVSPFYICIQASPTGLCESHCFMYLARSVHPEDRKDFRSIFVHVPLLTLCFMNCRNVRVDWLTAPEKWVKSFKKKHGIPPTSRTATLVITPMTKLLAKDLSEPGKTVAERKAAAAHRCRAHLKHYTEDRKLFGKVSGTFVWSSHVRNSGSEHSVTTDYRINTEGITVRTKHLQAKGEN